MVDCRSFCVHFIVLFILDKFCICKYSRWKWPELIIQFWCKCCCKAFYNDLHEEISDVRRRSELIFFLLLWCCNMYITWANLLQKIISLCCKSICFTQWICSWRQINKKHTQQYNESYLLIKRKQAKTKTNLPRLQHHTSLTSNHQHHHHQLYK